MPALVAAALARGEATVERLPDIEDLRSLRAILAALGIDSVGGPSSASFSSQSPRHGIIPAELSRRFRGSVYALAVPAVHLGEARIGLIGGDVLAGRSLKPHARAFAGFGLSLRERGGGWEVSGGRPRPGEFRLQDRPAGISATCLALLLAAATEGRSVLREASTELEVLDVVQCVRAFGAAVELDGSTLLIEGPLSRERAIYRVPVDHLYCGTLAVAAGLTRGEVLLPAEALPRLPAVVSALAEAGLDLAADAGSVRVRAASSLRPIRVETGTFPHFPTDLLPLMMALLTRADGASRLVERVYAHRFDQAPGLIRMGAAIRIDGNTATVTGPATLRGARVRGSGIRETTALVLAGLAADGITVVERAESVFRGYEDLVSDLAGLGADVRAEWQ
jgi:UDP-N-acetylglucosamine 1-carboxyvinyltransferase